MKLIWYDLRALWRHQKVVGMLLFFVPLIATFTIFFSCGVAVNNTHLNAEDSDSRELSISFSNMPYADVMDVVERIYEGIDREIIQGFGLNHMIINQGEGVDPRYTIIPINMHARLEGDVLVPYEIVYANNEIIQGRRMNRADFLSEEPRAVVVSYTEVVYDMVGMDFTVVGEFVPAKSESLHIPMTSVNPALMKKFPIRSLTLYLTRALVNEELQDARQIVEEKIPKYRLVHSASTNADKAAMRKTASFASVLTLLCAGYLLTLLYRYRIGTQRYSLAVYALVGGSRKRCCMLLFAEMLCSILPAVGLGAATFLVLDRLVIGEYYPYIEPLFTGTVYFGLIGCILVVLGGLCLGLAAYGTRQAVRAQLKDTKL